MKQKFGKPIEYKMSRAMADFLLGERKGDEKKMQPGKYLAKIINDQFGLNGNCINVIME